MTRMTQQGWRAAREAAAHLGARGAAANAAAVLAHRRTVDREVTRRLAVLRAAPSGAAAVRRIA